MVKRATYCNSLDEKRCTKYCKGAIILSYTNKYNNPLLSCAKRYVYFVMFCFVLFSLQMTNCILRTWNWIGRNISTLNLFKCLTHVFMIYLSEWWCDVWQKLFWKHFRCFIIDLIWKEMPRQAGTLWSEIYTSTGTRTRSFCRGLFAFIKKQNKTKQHPTTNLSPSAFFSGQLKSIGSLWN